MCTHHIGIRYISSKSNINIDNSNSMSSSLTVPFNTIITRRRRRRRKITIVFYLNDEWKCSKTSTKVERFMINCKSRVELKSLVLQITAGSSFCFCFRSAEYDSPFFPQYCSVSCTHYHLSNHPGNRIFKGRYYVTWINVLRFGLGTVN